MAAAKSDRGKSVEPPEDEDLAEQAKEKALKELSKWKKNDVSMWLNDAMGHSKSLLRKLVPHFKDGKTLGKSGKELKTFLEGTCKIYSSPQRRSVLEAITALKKGLIEKHLRKLQAVAAAAEEEALKKEQAEIVKLMVVIDEIEKKLVGADFTDKPTSDARLVTWANWKALLEQWDFTFENAPPSILIAGSGRTDCEFNQRYEKAGLYEERCCFVSKDKTIALRFESDKPSTAGWVLRVIKTRSLEYFCQDTMAATPDLATAKWQTWERDSWRTKPNITVEVTTDED